jgi:hypothetical protein
VNTVERVLAGIGIVAVVIGGAMLFVPGLASVLSLQATAILAIGLITLLQAFRVGKQRYTDDLEFAQTPDPETEQDLVAPGQEFDDVLEAVDPTRLRVINVNREPEMGENRPVHKLEDRMEAAAIATIVRKWGCSRERAKRALETGEWTDDQAAAGFFNGEVEHDSLRERLRFALSAELQGKQRAVRAADEIADLSERSDVDEEVLRS